MEKEFIPYGIEWQKELKSKPKDFLVDFLRNSLINIIKLEEEKTELKECMHELMVCVNVGSFNLGEVMDKCKSKL